MIIVAGAFFLGAIYWFHRSNKEKIQSPFKTYANLIPGTYRVGFTDLNEEVNIKSLPIKGTVPPWLEGTLYRNGPAKFTSDGSAVSHWFDGLAMIHAFSMNNGVISYKNKFLRTRDYEFVKNTGKMFFSGFAQDPCKSLFRSIASFFIPTTGDVVQNANINIGNLSERLVAFYETPLPVEFDPQTLETLGVMHYNDGLPESRIHDTAHPHYDAQRKEYLGYFTRFGKVSNHNLFRIKDGATQRQIIASIDVEEPSYMHSFAITKNYAILTALPFVVNTLDLLLKRKAFIKNFKWKPEIGTRFMVIDRVNDRLVDIFTSEPFFAFHMVNAYEEGDLIVLDCIIYPNSSVVGDATFAKLLEPHQSSRKEDHPQLTRFIIDLNNKTIVSHKISDESIELPRINYEGFNAKDYTYVYAYAKRDKEFAYIADKLVKINVKTGDVTSWHQEHCYPGEPVFIGAPNSQAEDDGVILSVVLNAQLKNSFLLVLDGKNFKEIARAEVPHHIPFGLHGIFVSDT